MMKKLLNLIKLVKDFVKLGNEKMNRRTKWMKNTRDVIERLKVENDKLKQFEDYSCYVGTEVTCG